MKIILDQELCLVGTFSLELILQLDYTLESSRKSVKNADFRCPHKWLLAKPRKAVLVFSNCSQRFSQLGQDHSPQSTAFDSCNIIP